MSDIDECYDHGRPYLGSLDNEVLECSHLL
jgi:hypothetical protein